MNNVSSPNSKLTAYTWRSVQEEDLPAIQSMLSAVGQSESSPRVATLDKLRRLLSLLGEKVADNTLVGLDGDEIVGFCVNWVDESEKAEQNVHQGWFEAIGVLSAWRGRGIASALLSHSLQLFQEVGWKQAGLDVDTQNPTGALRLYEKHGFTVAEEKVFLLKRLT